jgi:uncharacterized membrane protein YraQ (UPF0718 family)
MEKKRGSLIDGSFLVFLAIAAILGGLCYLRGRSVFVQGLEASWGLFIDLLPRITGALLFPGFVEVLIPKDVIRRWIGEGSGFKGILIATLAGMIMPGGPMVSFPLITMLYRLGADAGPLVAYLTSWEILGLQRIIVWEVPMMGVRFALLRFIVSLLLPVIAGVIARKLALHMFRSFEASKV